MFNKAKDAQWKVKEKMKNTYYDTKVWITNNQELVNKVIVPLAITIVPAVITAGVKVNKGRVETNLKDRRCYDTSLGHYWELKRKLKSSEWVAIERRKQNGEKLGSILDEMKVLK